jgi:hypothetical protein
MVTRTSSTIGRRCDEEACPRALAAELYVTHLSASEGRRIHVRPFLL